MTSRLKAPRLAKVRLSVLSASRSCEAMSLYWLETIVGCVFACSYPFPSRNRGVDGLAYQSGSPQRRQNERRRILAGDLPKRVRVLWEVTDEEVPKQYSLTEQAIRVQDIH